MKRVLFLILILCSWLAVSMAQTAAFVSVAAPNDNGDGLSWETAKQTIAAGLAVVGENGTVYVKAGTYNISATLVIPAGVSLRGGFSLNASGTDTAQTKQRLPGPNSQWGNVSVCTIIVGNGSHRIATVNGLLESCVLRRGFDTDKGGGVLIDGGKVRYCVIKECDAINENTLAAEGGGAYIRNNGLLTNCVITECRADKGPAVSGGNGSLINNTITRNWPSHCGTVADYDGNVYNTVVIGQQCWTKQNMRSMHYYDGSLIPKGSENSVEDPYYCVNYTAITPASLSNYGYLYNWVAAMHGAPTSNSNPSGVTGICPMGWHVPSDSEFVEMRDFVNTILANRCNGYDYLIAKSLVSKTDWPWASGCSAGNSPSTNNNTLFTAYPAGYFHNGFSGLNCTDFWTTTEANADQAVAYYMNYDNDHLSNDNVNKVRAHSVRCVKQLSVSDPVVHTRFVTVLSATTVELRGSCSDGGFPITVHGFCWSSSSNPTVDGPHSNDGVEEGDIRTVLSGLTPNTTYYVRAYVENANGVYYGEELSFIPTSDCGTLVVTDIEGNYYHTVQLGPKCWLSENIRSIYYADGERIPTSTYFSSSSPLYYQSGGGSEYGLLYNWPAVMRGAASSDANPSGVQGICPDGWHVPSRSEWEQMKNYVSNQSEYFCNNDPTYIGKALASTTGWIWTGSTCCVGNNPQNNNATGFNAPPAGFYSEGAYNSYYYRQYNEGAAFWSSTNTFGMGLHLGSAGFSNITPEPTTACSVRCVRDE